MAQTGQPEAGLDEQVKAKLYELENLKKREKIGQEAHDELKEEYEKRLVQTDLGTQIY